jgi:hypothetical protein
MPKFMERYFIQSLFKYCIFVVMLPAVDTLWHHGCACPNEEQSDGTGDRDTYTVVFHGSMIFNETIFK